MLTEHLQTRIAPHLVNDGTTRQRQHLRMDDCPHRDRLRSAGPQQTQGCACPKLHLLPVIDSAPGRLLRIVPGPTPEGQNDFDHRFHRQAEGGRDAIDDFK